MNLIQITRTNHHLLIHTGNHKTHFQNAPLAVCGCILTSEDATTPGIV